MAFATPAQRRLSRVDLSGTPSSPYRQAQFSSPPPAGPSGGRLAGLSSTTSSTGYDGRQKQNEDAYSGGTSFFGGYAAGSELKRRAVFDHESVKTPSKGRSAPSTPAKPELAKEAFYTPITPAQTGGPRALFTHGKVAKDLFEAARRRRQEQYHRRVFAFVGLAMSSTVFYMFGFSRMWRVFSWGLFELGAVFIFVYSLAIFFSETATLPPLPAPAPPPDLSPVNMPTAPGVERPKPTANTISRVPSAPTMPAPESEPKRPFGSAKRSEEYGMSTPARARPTYASTPGSAPPRVGPTYTPTPGATPRHMASTALVPVPEASTSGTRGTPMYTPVKSSNISSTSPSVAPGSLSRAVASPADLAALTRQFHAVQEQRLVAAEQAATESTYNTRGGYTDYMDVDPYMPQQAPLKYCIGYSQKAEEREQVIGDDTFVSVTEDNKKAGQYVEDNMDLWVRNFRKWLCSRVLRAVASRIEVVDRAIPHFRVGDVMTSAHGQEYERIKQMSNQQLLPGDMQAQMARQLWDERMVIERYLDVPNAKNKKYILHRLRELANSEDLEMFRWNSGGFYHGLPWSTDHPTDSQLVFHWFCTFMDIVMPCQIPHRHNDAEGPCEKPFTKYYTHTRDTLKASKGQIHREVCIYFDEVSPPRFTLMRQAPKGPSGENRVIEDRSVWSQPGRDNLFQVISLFVYRAKTDMHGHLGAINLGGMLGLLSILEMP